MRNPRILLALALAACVALPALAQQTIDQTRPAQPDGLVFVDNLSGSVKVSGWDRAEVQVTGTLGRGTERLDFTSEGRKTVVKVVLPKHASHVDGSDLTLRVPAGSALDLSTVSADVEISGVKGRVAPKTVSGNITVQGSPSQVRAETVSGEVKLTGECPEVKASSVSGTVTVKGASGRVSGSSVSGDVVVEAGALQEAEASTTSGDVKIAGGLAKDGQLEVSTVSGDVTLTLPAATSADFRVSTFSGGITSDFGGEARSEEEHGMGKKLTFSTGGGAHVSVKTFSGSVKLLKK